MPDQPLPYVLNCIPSREPQRDWSWQAALDAGTVQALSSSALPDSVDLRSPDWTVSNQGQTGACVGFATADGLLRYHFAKKGAIGFGIRLSARFIWMADKETDTLTSYPTTFIEQEGTEVKRALDIARTYGCALEGDLPLHGALWQGTAQDFYTKAARFKIRSYHNLGVNLTVWRKWLATGGPIISRLVVDSSWMKAGARGELVRYNADTAGGGHAVCIVGYRADGAFIIRNSWSEAWGDKGFVYASPDYMRAAFSEGYGIIA